MAITQYIAITGPDIKGESQVANHKDEIQINSCSMGGTNSGGFHVGSGGGTGTFTAGDVVVSSFVGKQSTQLLLNCFKGTHVNQVVISSDKTGGGAQAYTFWKITLTDCVISSYNVSAAPGGSDDWYMETWSINYTQAKVEYFLQDPKKGTVALANSCEYNMAQKQTVGA